MKRRNFLQAATLTAIATSFGRRSWGSILKKQDWKQPFIKVKKDSPNILWLCTDQQRWDTIGALGNKYVHTPNLDRLVNEGVSFTNAHCTSPICTSSRSSFLTGHYPMTVRGCKNGAAEWAEAKPLITKTLKDGGYDCGLSGKLHLSTAMAHRPEKRPKDDGYRVYHYSHSPYQTGSANDYIMWGKAQGVDIIDLKSKLGYVPSEYHQTKWCTDMAIDFISEKREWPWLFSWNVFDPHGPFDPPKEYLDRYDIDNLPLPLFRDSDLEQKSIFNDKIYYPGKPKRYSDRQNRERLAKYLAQIDLIDYNIGRLIQSLEETGQLNNTMIIFTSDHGDSCGDHGLTGKGCHFYEGLVRVPLIFRMPGRLKKGLKSNAMVELSDIVPTLLELTGLRVPEDMQGKSLLPILRGEASPDHHKDFVRSEFYDTVHQEGHPHSWATMLKNDRYKIVNYHGIKDGELFDLENDPGEFNNLWYDKKYRDIRFEMLNKSYDTTVLAIDTGPERLGRY